MKLKSGIDTFSRSKPLTPANLVSEQTRSLCAPDPSPDVVLGVCTSAALHPCPPLGAPLRAPLCLLLAGSCDREAHSASGKRRLNMVWWGMWENSRVHLYIHRPACQPSSRPSRPLSAWTRGAFVPHLLATPCPAPAPHLTLLSILLRLLCLPLFTGGSGPRIAQQDPSENRAGDVGRVRVSLSPLSSVSPQFCFSLSPQNHSFVSEVHSETVISSENKRSACQKDFKPWRY